MSSDVARCDRGSATVWSVGAIAALLTVAAVLVQLGGVSVARHQAESAADLAALAGAGRAVAGAATACERAGSITDRMRVHLESCRVQGWDVLVEVSARPGGPLGNVGVATARARAGPVRS
ncbi:MAG: hypothetical protein GEV09_09520 [Pseudonocardiaceae bacterium]|nr:hypothetical protein [Pseudonocardiaceae bacterium]